MFATWLKTITYRNESKYMAAYDVPISILTMVSIIDIACMILFALWENIFEHYGCFLNSEVEQIFAKSPWNADWFFKMQKKQLIRKRIKPIVRWERTIVRLLLEVSCNVFRKFSPLSSYWITETNRTNWKRIESKIPVQIRSGGFLFDDFNLFWLSIDWTVYVLKQIHAVNVQLQKRIFTECCSLE